MDGTECSRSGVRRNRRSRSQRDREWRRRRRRSRSAQLERSASSPSSGSERDIPGPAGMTGDSRLDRAGRYLSTGSRRRPPRRRKREPTSWEEDIIDGFAIASFVSLEALQNDFPLKPSDRVAFLMGRGSKRKRNAAENGGGGALLGCGEGDPSSYHHGYNVHSRKRGRKPETTGSFLLEAGYISDTESDSGHKASENDLDPVFTVCTRKDPGLLGVGSFLNKDGAPKSLSWRYRLSVTSCVSGLQRSQEKCLGLPFTELPAAVSSSPSSTYSHSSLVSATCSSSAPLITSNGDGLPRSTSTTACPWPKHKPFLFFPARQQSHYNMDSTNRTSTVARPPTSSSASSVSSLSRPTSNASMTFSLSIPPNLSGALQPQARSSSGPSFNPSPGLPLPPPLLQAPSQSSTGKTTCGTTALAGQDPLSQEVRSHSPSSQSEKAEGGATLAQTQMNGGAGSSAAGKASASGSGRLASASAAQAQPAGPPLSFQFHQHSHQHQHTHTHQHFTPFLPPLATAAPLFDKCSGKMEGLYRQTYLSQYPPGVSRLQSVLPSSGPFSSLQGAFQPKGTSPEISARLGPVPHHMQPKDPKLPDPFRTSLRVSKKPGKWCAMHVRIALMILRHQERAKGDPHKADFCPDMLTRLPGAPTLSGVGDLSSLATRLQTAHNVARPASFFSPSGGIHPSSAPFVPPLPPQSSFLTPPGHFDPFGPLLPYNSLGSLGSSAFGGLGTTTLVPSSVFSPKESPGRTRGGIANSHDLWHRLHCMPAFSSASPWAQGCEKREEPKQGKDDSVIQVKYEKDRDWLAYGRRPAHMSPAGHPISNRSSTPASHSNPHERVAEPEGPPKNGPALSRCREKNSKQPSSQSSRAQAAGSSAATSERPCSSSSSAPPTPVPTSCLAPSPFDLYGHQQPSSRPSPQLESSCVSQKDTPQPLRPSASLPSQDKTTDRNIVPLPKSSPDHLSPRLVPPVKVKEERKDEMDPVSGSLLPSHQSQQTFDQPSGRNRAVSPPPPSHLCLRPSPGVPLPPPTPQPPPHLLSLSLPPRAVLAASGHSGGIIVGAPGDRFPFSHIMSQGHCQPAHVCPWDLWRDQHREALAMRSDAHIARLFQHQHAQRFLEAERATGVAAAVASPHLLPATSASSASSSSSVQQEFGLARPPHQEQSTQSAGSGGSGGLLSDDQRTRILQEELERARYYGMHPHLSSPLLGHSHVDQLYTGFLSHSPPRPPGAAGPPHQSSLYSRLGPLHSHPQPRHVASGLLSKTTSGLVGSLSVGAPPPLIPSVTPGRASISPHSSRFAPTSELVLYNTHKDRESR